ILSGDGADRCTGPEHRAAKRLAIKRGFEQMIMDEVIRGVGHLAQLGQDHLLLALEVLLLEMRAPQEICEKLGDQRQIARERTSLKCRLVACRPGIEATTDILDHFCKSARIAPAGTLEHHVLDNM